MNSHSAGCQISKPKIGPVYCAKYASHFSIQDFCEFRGPKTHELGQNPSSGGLTGNSRLAGTPRAIRFGHFLEIFSASKDESVPVFLLFEK